MVETGAYRPQEPCRAFHRCQGTLCVPCEARKDNSLTLTSK